MGQSILELITYGLYNAMSPYHLLLMSLGTIAGIIGGALPGITSTTAIALMLPFTLSMNPSSGLVLLGAIWVGAMYGGSIAATLFKVSGTPSAIATTFDAYPMAMAGDADKALFTSLISSATGGFIGALCLMLLFAPLARISVKFSKPEYFWLVVFGLTTIASISSKNIIKGLISVLIGLLIITIGLDPFLAIPRFTFGYNRLIMGINMVPILIGVFGFSQVLTIMERHDKFLAEIKTRKFSILISSGLSEIWKKCKIILLRSSLIGTFVGMLPGAGGPIGSIIAYNEAVRWDKNPKKYGTGVVEGIAASESANNGNIGCSLIPMMGLGIPGCP